MRKEVVFEEHALEEFNKLTQEVQDEFAELILLLQSKENQ
jgi:hypothetical protein